MSLCGCEQSRQREATAIISLALHEAQAIRHHCICIRELLQQAEFRIQFPGKPQVIGVEKSDQFPVSQANAGVSRRAYTSAAWLAKQMDAGTKIPRKYFRCIISRAVINDNDLHLSISLA